MALYGIYGEHTQAACPLYNKEVRQELLSRAPKLQKRAEKMGALISFSDDL
jgi:hypothetical protein